MLAGQRRSTRIERILCRREQRGSRGERRMARVFFITPEGDTEMERGRPRLEQLSVRERESYSGKETADASALHADRFPRR
jgi:hypothetical protein